jgi:gluconate 2-dehydrogenase gamma chain
MKRRDNLKLLLAGGLGSTLAVTSSCKNEGDTSKISNAKSNLYGRTAEEIAHDNAIYAAQFFTPEEMKSITLLSDIIVPVDDVSGGASQAGVPAFIEFIAKDMTIHQLPLRGGLKWLDNQCTKRYQKIFSECSPKQQLEIVDLIAYPDKATVDMKPGVKFFTHMRNLVLTGFYTSKIGIKDIGYKGNTPNEWDGVPDEVLKKHGLAYDARTLEISIKMEDRNRVVKWDNEGNIVG